LEQDREDLHHELLGDSVEVMLPIDIDANHARPEWNDQGLSVKGGSTSAIRYVDSTRLFLREYRVGSECLREPASPLTARRVADAALGPSAITGAFIGLTSLSSARGHYLGWRSRSNSPVATGSQWCNLLPLGSPLFDILKK
jgi:hypothetical protein